MVCRAGARGRLRLRELHPGVHRLERGLGARFEAKRLPMLGDDIKSQVGATIVHRMLANLFRERGVRLDRTYQLNFGGNTDFMNMLERDRLESKKLSKTRAVNSQLRRTAGSDAHRACRAKRLRAVAHDRKWCYIRMEGTTFGNVPLYCELKLEVGIAQLGRRGDRCRALRQARARSRHRRRTDGSFELLHEEPA